MLAGRVQFASVCTPWLGAAANWTYGARHARWHRADEDRLNPGIHHTVHGYAADLGSNRILSGFIAAEAVSGGKSSEQSASDFTGLTVTPVLQIERPVSRAVPTFTLNLRTVNAAMSIEIRDVFSLAAQKRGKSLSNHTTWGASTSSMRSNTKA